MEAGDAAVEDAIRRVRRGDVDAFGELVRAFQWPLRAWVAARCPPGIDPDEVAHLAFIQAYSSLGQYQAGTRFRAWLWTIARNQLLSEIAKLRRREGNDDDYLPEAMRRALERDAAEGGDDDEHLEALRGCLDGLAPHARVLLDQHYRDGRPLAEIAETVARSVPSVKKGLFLARRALEECMRRRLARSGA